MSNSIATSIAKSLAGRRERRAARARQAALEQDLATFRTEREVDDLLGAVRETDGREAEQIRDILLDNLRPTTGLGRI
jgi:hypothetical protein